MPAASPHAPTHHAHACGVRHTPCPQATRASALTTPVRVMSRTSSNWAAMRPLPHLRRACPRCGWAASGGWRSQVRAQWRCGLACLCSMVHSARHTTRSSAWRQQARRGRWWRHSPTRRARDSARARPSTIIAHATHRSAATGERPELGYPRDRAQRFTNELIPSQEGKVRTWWWRRWARRRPCVRVQHGDGIRARRAAVRCS